METNSSTSMSRFNVHPTATIIKEHFSGIDPDKDFVFERQKPSKLFSKFTLESAQTIQNNYLQQLVNPIKNFLKRDVPILNKPCSIVDDSRIRAIIFQAEAIAATSDRPNLRDLRFESIFRELLTQKATVWPKKNLRINPIKIFYIKIKLKLKQNLSDNNKQVLKDTALALQIKLALNFIQERSHNLQNIINATRQHNINDLFPDIDQPLLSRLNFICGDVYTGYIRANNDTACCGELTGYALYKNYILSNKKINTIASYCSITFQDYTELPGPRCIFKNHACIILMDINEFIEQKDKKKLADCRLYLTDQDVLLPPVFKNVTAVIADPWLKTSEIITPFSWSVYLKKIAKECGLQTLESYSIKFKLLYE